MICSKTQRMYVLEINIRITYLKNCQMLDMHQILFLL